VLWPRLALRGIADTLDARADDDGAAPAVDAWVRGVLRAVGPVTPLAPSTWAGSGDVMVRVPVASGVGSEPRRRGDLDDVPRAATGPVEEQHNTPDTPLPRHSYHACWHDGKAMTNTPCDVTLPALEEETGPELLGVVRRAREEPASSAALPTAPSRAATVTVGPTMGTAPSIGRCGDGAS
jgi:hypothetical protein